MNTAVVLNDVSSVRDSHLGNPYLAARKEWDERYGSLIKRAQNWRLAAMLALLVAFAEAVARHTSQVLHPSRERRFLHPLVYWRAAFHRS